MKIETECLHAGYTPRQIRKAIRKNTRLVSGETIADIQQALEKA